MKRDKYPPPQDLFDCHCSYRKYVMVSTVLSEKFIYLLQIIEQPDRYSHRLCDLAEDVRDRSCECKNSAINAAARDTGLSIDVLLRCSIAYSNIDLHMGSVSIERKIEIFNGCIEKGLEDEQIIAELFDYADEIQACSFT